MSRDGRWLRQPLDEKTRKGLFHKTVTSKDKEGDPTLSSGFGLAPEETESSLETLWCGFHNHLDHEDEIEKVPTRIVRQSLKELGIAANALAGAMRHLTQGGVDLLVHFSSGFQKDAQADGLPSFRAWEGCEPLPVQEATNSPWYRHVEALAKQAELCVRYIEESTGGQSPTSKAKTFAEFAGVEDPHEVLALNCVQFAKNHGCQKHGAAIKLYQAIMKAEYGSKAVGTQVGHKIIKKLWDQP